MNIRTLLCSSLLGLGLLTTSAVQASYVDDSKTYQPRMFESRGLPLYEVPVCWHSSGSDTLKNQVRQAVENTWERYSKLDFTGWTQCPSGNFHGIRVEHNIVSSSGDVVAWTKGTGSSTWRLRDPGMYLQFGSDSACNSQHGLTQCTQAIAIHEFGHAIGFWHEQGRIDTPSSCTAKQVRNGYADFTKYDANSIMNYCSPNRRVPALSALDILTVKAYYDNIPTYYQTSASSDIVDRTITIPYLQIDGQSERYSATLVDSDGDGKFELTQLVSATLTSKYTLSTFSNSTGIVNIPLVKMVNKYQDTSVYGSSVVNRIDTLYQATLQQLSDGQFQIKTAVVQGQ